MQAVVDEHQTALSSLAVAAAGSGVASAVQASPFQLSASVTLVLEGPPLRTSLPKDPTAMQAVLDGHDNP